MATILIDARESGTSTGRYHDKLIEYLHKQNPQEHFIILTKPERLAFFANIAPDFRALSTPFKEFTFGEQFGLMRQIKSLRPDLVHFGMVQQPILLRGKVVTTTADLTTTRFKNPTKNPAVFFIKQQVYKMVYRIVPHTSKQIIVLSNFVKRDVAAYAHVRPSKITVTYAAADFIPDPPEALPSLAEKGFLLYVGRPLPHKNLPRLIEAFKTLKLQHPELKLVLAGKKDALYESIENEVSRQGIKDVVFTGFVTEGNLRWLYEHCAAYIFPSLSEGFGLPGLEAMEHGAPVVSSNATCLPEIYGDAAFYFNPTDIGSIVSAINNVLVDPILREQLIERGRTQVKKFSWPRMASETLSVYRKVLNS